MEAISFEQFKHSDKRPFVTVGMFDGVHIGHRRLIEDLRQRAKENGTEAVVISFLNHPREVLGKTDGGFGLLQTREERFEKLARCGANRLVYLNFTPSLAQMEASEFLDMLIERINPQEVLVGYDNRFGRKGSNEFDTIIEKGVYRNVRVERSDCKIFCEDIEVSSTQIRLALQKGEVGLAAKMLEEPYRIGGVVESGQQIGRKIGFPTANIKLNERVLLPKEGVYAVKVRLGDRILGGVANLGGKPTIDTKAWTCEVHIFDFQEQIYGKEIEIEFIERLREQKQFADLESLKQQIEKDSNEAKRILGI